MAPASDQLYFPSLEECLKGDAILLSWKLVASSLADESDARRNCTSLSEFLNDDYVQALLRDPTKALGPPDDATNSDFETKTSAIHVTPNANADFDVHTIKEDARWLRTSANLNLVAALRITVLEFQNRPANHLSGPLSTADAINLREAAGVTDGQTSSLLPIAGVTMDGDQLWTEFNKEENRRLRIYQTYMAERRYLAMSADQIQTASLHQQQRKQLPQTESKGKSNEVAYPVLPLGDKPQQSESLISSNLKLLMRTIDSMTKGYTVEITEKSLHVEELEMDWQRTLLTQAVHALSVIFQALDANGDAFVTQDSIIDWFAAMESCGFFDGIDAPHESIDSLVLPIQTLVCAISLKFLNPTRALAFLAQETELRGEESNPYLSSPDALIKIHEAIRTAVDTGCESQSPVILLWTVIAHRMSISHNERAEKRDTLQNQRSQETFESGALIRPTTGRRLSAGSIVSLDNMPFDAFLTASGLRDDVSAMEKLAQAVTAQGRVYDIVSQMLVATASSSEGSFTPTLTSRLRLVFVEFLNTTYPLVGYQSEPVTTFLTVLSTGRSYWDLYTAVPDTILDVSAKVLKDPQAFDFYFYQAFSRYPFEFMPFVSFCRSLAYTTPSDDTSDTVINLLRTTPSLTLVLPDDFQAYELAADDESANTFRLLEDIPLFSTKSTWRSRAREDTSGSLSMPAGTIGRFLADTGRVVLMEYEHSGLALICKRLEVTLSPDLHFNQFDALGAEEVAEAIALLATLLGAEACKAEKRGFKGDERLRVGSELLDEASKHISGNQDIISVVCTIMDLYMQDDQATAEGHGIVVLNSCAQFLHAVLALCPTRVWSYIARCDLLNTDSRAGKLTRLVGNLDLSADRYDFLLSTMRLLSSLVDSVMKSAVQRKSGNRLVGRQQVTNNVWVGVADKILSRVSLAIAQALVDVFESSSTWRFPSDMHQTLLLRHIVPAMDKLVTDTYSIGDSSSSDSLTTCLQPAADYVIESFQSASNGSLRFQALLRAWVMALEIPDLTLYPEKLNAIRWQVISSVNFATHLLRATSFLERQSGPLEQYLFKTTSIFARLCAVDEDFKQPAMSVLGALVVNAAQTSDDPPSLLGYLGPLLSRSFLQLLSRLGKPLSLQDEARATWQFFSIIVQNRQQWMSNCLLTGKTPRDALRGDKKSPDLMSTSVLSTAFSRLKIIDRLERGEALRVLEFVASAQDHWPWTIFTMQRDSSYFSSLSSFVKSLRSASTTAKTDASKAAEEAKMAAYIAQIFAMQLYHQRQMGISDDLAQSLVGDLDYYLRDGVQVASYNNSLHNNFNKNFTAKYPGVPLDSLKRTYLEPRDLGKAYFYALDRANEMLDFDPGWHGRRDDGFRNEMRIVNMNLSLVDAQISLLNSWQFLLLELNSCVPKNQTLHRQMLQVAQQCLEANESYQGPENIFARIMEDRALLAFTLLQRLVGTKVSANDVVQLFGGLFSVLGLVQEPFAPNTIDYYRTILRTVYVSLRLFSSSDKKDLDASASNSNAAPVALTQTILNLLDTVVAKGFRMVVTLIHENETTVAPEDLALLTAILQSSLSVPGMKECQTQILNIMASHDVMHAAMSLFSWADKLTVNDDPIYAELSLLFVLELSTLSTVAEQMAADGLLSQLTSANITNFMRKSVISPFSDVAGAQRCYSIWAKGVLPLLLNLLTVLAGTVAPEVAYVLSQFPHLLKSSVERFEAPGASRTASRDAPHYVTLLAVSEVHSLALITKIIEALRVNNNRDIPAVQWDASTLLENIEFWLSSRKLLKERVLPLGQREMDWKRMPCGENSGGSGSDASKHENLLEAKVISQMEAVRGVLSDDLEEQ